MKCVKCGHENPDTVQFCVRCHAPVRYTCPACKHVQDQGGQCEKCGTDFTKYAMMLMFQARTQAEQERDAARGRQSVIKQILLLPITGGLSLIGYFRSLARRE